MRPIVLRQVEVQCSPDTIKEPPAEPVPTTAHRQQAEAETVAKQPGSESPTSNGLISLKQAVANVSKDLLDELQEQLRADFREVRRWKGMDRN